LRCFSRDQPAEPFPDTDLALLKGVLERLSPPLYAGEFASFCELTPARYKYKVIRHSTPNSGVDSGSRRLEGEIIVGKPS
jgi:hypothetical protein